MQPSTYPMGVPCAQPYYNPAVNALSSTATPATVVAPECGLPQGSTKPTQTAASSVIDVNSTPPAQQQQATMPDALELEKQLRKNETESLKQGRLLTLLASRIANATEASGKRFQSMEGIQSGIQTWADATEEREREQLQRMEELEKRIAAAKAESGTRAKAIQELEGVFQTWADATEKCNREQLQRMEALLERIAAAKAESEARAKATQDLERELEERNREQLQRMGALADVLLMSKAESETRDKGIQDLERSLQTWAGATENRSSEYVNRMLELEKRLQAAETRNQEQENNLQELEKRVQTAVTRETDVVSRLRNFQNHVEDSLNRNETVGTALVALNNALTLSNQEVAVLQKRLHEAERRSSNNNERPMPPLEASDATADGERTPPLKRQRVTRSMDRAT